MDPMNVLVQDWQLSKTSVQGRFKELLNRSQWTDCAFRVGSDNVEVIHAHKLVLAASSPVFEALFYGSMAAGNDQVISIPDIEPHIFHVLLRYVYSDELNLTSIEEAGELLYTAKKYLLQPLSLLCLCYIIQHTSIKTLWHVLFFAEALNEEQLILPCIKVMSKYCYEIWRSDTENMSASTLCRLLEEDHMNMSEAEVWDMVLDWSHKELESREITDNPENKRAILDEAGILKRVRFLALTPNELDTLLVKPVLKEEEVEVLKKKREAPSGLCNVGVPRARAPTFMWRSSRDIIFNRSQMWFDRAEVVSKISSTTKVLVVGFELVTRLAQITDYIRMPPDSSYREKLVLFIKDSDGNILQKTDYDSNVRFNSHQSVDLVRPFWFDLNVTYTISISYIEGLYTVSKFSDASSTATKFFFEDLLFINGSHQLSTSIITSVFYAL